MTPHDPKSVAGKKLHVAERTQVLVVGAGPAGLSAAIEAAGLGLQVMLVDENPIPAATMGEDVPLHFGQAFSAAARNRNAMTEQIVVSEPLFEAAYEAGVDVRLGTAVWGLYANGPSVGWLPGPIAAVADEDHSWLVGTDRLIVAAGRRDMGLAFPGWHLPRVLGATAAQRLAERYRALGLRRVVVLGTSNESLVATLALLRCGVQIAAVIEQTSEPIGEPDLIAALASSGVEVLTGRVIHEALGRDGVEGVVVRPADAGALQGASSVRHFECDGVVIGVGTTPVIELLDALGCHVTFQPERGGYAPVLDSSQRTSIPLVYAIGDAAGVWPAKTRDRTIAEREGVVAAQSVAASLGRESKPQPISMPPPDVPSHDISAYRLGWVRASVLGARREAFVCQCEEVTAREILELRPPRYLGPVPARCNAHELSSLQDDAPPSPDQVKRLTRAGMGLCQGRRCREQIAALLALGTGVTLDQVPLAGYRAPVRPLALMVACDLEEDNAMAEHWDIWFGIAAQWRPFWECKGPYRAARRGDGAIGTE